MDKIKYFVMVLAAIAVVTSCKPKGYDFEKTVAEDLSYIEANYPQGIFYESQVAFNAAADTSKFSKLYVDKMCDVFQSNDTVILMTHESDAVGKDAVVTVIPEEFVMEDSPIEYPVAFTLKEAVKALRESSCTTPHSNKMTLRRPFGPNPNNNPQYIFGSGSDTTYAFVNANTLKISNSYDYERNGSTELVGDWIGNLDHDIYVGNVSCIENDSHTGFDTWVGPTGWPWTDKVMWETALYEDANFYYGRFIFHEYMLWWSWDYPYVVCKIPKANVGGDLRTNEKLRNEVMWKLTNNTLKSYDYTPYIKNRVVKHINGHIVSFGDYACKYKEYYVISDSEYDW